MQDSLPVTCSALLDEVHVSSVAFTRSLRKVSSPGRTGQLPTRNPHRPGRAQLRHPVPLVKVSLNTSCSPVTAVRCRCVYMLFWVPVYPGFLCIRSASLPLTVLFPGAALPGVTSHPLYRSGVRERGICTGGHTGTCESSSFLGVTDRRRTRRVIN